MYLKLLGTEAENIVALKSIHPDMIAKNKFGNDVLRNIYNHKIALEVFKQVVVVPGTYDTQGIELTAPITDGPIVMVKFLIGQKLGALTATVLEEWKTGVSSIKFAVN